VIHRLLVAARAGRGGALVIGGEPGIGKTSLLAYAVDSAAGLRVLRIRGTEAEMGIAYAGVHQLVAPLLDDLDRLPEPQRRALAVAFGLAEGGPQKALHVNLAVASLVGRAPTLCAVDDAHWLDSASLQTLSFVARRLESSPMAMLLAVREPAKPRPAFAGLPELRLTGLTAEDAALLVSAATADRVDPLVLKRIAAETSGNPAAMLDLTGALTTPQRTGRASLPDPLPVHGALEHELLRRVRRLPDETQWLLLLLAAAPHADSDVLRHAAATLGLDPAAGDAAEDEGLVVAEPRLVFRHPFLGAAVYRAARSDQRRRAHAALADATDRRLDPEGHAWHRAASLAAPNERAAANLAAAGERIGERDGYGAAVAVLTRAAQLTPNPALRAERSLVAARAEYALGATGRASALLNAAAPALTSVAGQADAARLRSALDYELGRSPETHGVQLARARAVEPVDVDRARVAHLDALVASLRAGRLSDDNGVRTAAESARTAPAATAVPGTARDLLLEGLALRFTDGPGAAAPVLRLALDMLRHDRSVGAIALGIAAAGELWNDSALQSLCSRQVELARESAALAELAPALNQLAANYEIVVGRFDAADACLQEAREIRSAIAPALADRGRTTAALVDAWRGRDAEARAAAQAALRDAAARGQGIEMAAAQHALAILDIGLGHYPSALAAAQDATTYDTLLVVTATLPELVEAAVRAGEPETAARALDRLIESTTASGSHWALGMLARSRALVAEGDDAEPLYEQAVTHLQQCRALPQLARAYLVHGEWLRRERRRLDARRPLRIAHEMFRAMGAEAFDERARIELLATGERGRPRTAETLEHLTAHENRIARLVADGASNPQIALELGISRRTVEYHLRKIFRKLGISSRTQLAGALARL
jgi:DNA-binding CsgD family transcriptional regulator